MTAADSPKIKIIVPSYNSSRWLRLTLTSIEQQLYKNYEVCVIDDASTDPAQKTVIGEFCSRNNWKGVYNTVNQGALSNIVKAVKDFNCQDDDIIMVIDGDDWLFNQEALLKVVKTYQEKKVFLTYGTFVYYPKPRMSPRAFIPPEVIKNKNYRAIRFCFTHLKTFKYILWRHIEDKDLRDDNGEYFRVAWDEAFMWPMVEMAGTHFCEIKDIVYVYNIGNPINDHKLYWKKLVDTRLLLEKRKKYDTLPCCK